MPLLLTATCALLGATARAAERPIPPLPAVDDDFALQGEYAGALEDASGGACRCGLQVIALGNGDFQAVEFCGGLPGNGGARRIAGRFTGRRAGHAAELTGPAGRVRLETNLAVLLDAAGRERGRLRKFHRLSRTLGAAPPPGATVLFSGTSTDEWTTGAATDDGLLQAGADTRRSFGDFTLHLEFRTPYQPAARGQGRGNSGVYIQGRYEVQILDSFGLEGLNNECGGLYKTQAPLLNMCFPPMAWQTYDIDFVAARFDAAGCKVCPARITVRHNGIVVQKDYPIPDKTGAGAAEGPDPRPLRLQNHGDAVHFRNVWIVEGPSRAHCICLDRSCGTP